MAATNFQAVGFGQIIDRVVNWTGDGSQGYPKWSDRGSPHNLSLGGVLVWLLSSATRT